MRMYGNHYLRLHIYLRLFSGILFYGFSSDHDHTNLHNVTRT